MYQSIVFSASALAVLLITYLMRGKKELCLNTLKVLTVLFCVTVYVRFLLSDSFIYVINGGWFNGKYYETTDVFQSILRWGYYTNCAVLPVAVFRSGRFLKNVAGYFSLPFTILSTIFIEDYMQYFLAPEGHGFHTAEWIRYALFMFELSLAIIIPIALHITERHIFRFSSFTEWRNYFFGLVGVLLTMIPTYLPQSLFGYTIKIPEIMSNYHLVWMGVLLIVTLFIYYAFRFRNYEARYSLCLFLTLVLFFHYHSLYLMGITLKRLPFQLCNIASYFYMIMIIFKKKRMFEFIFIANMVGTLFAIIAPDFAAGNFSFWNTHFIIEHSLVLIIPAMAMGLRIFPRINAKSLRPFFIGYTV